MIRFSYLLPSPDNWSTYSKGNLCKPIYSVAVGRKYSMWLASRIPLLENLDIPDTLYFSPVIDCTYLGILHGFFNSFQVCCMNIIFVSYQMTEGN